MVVRQHGFQRPFAVHQIASWVFYALFLATFFVLYSPVYVDTLGFVWSGLYTVLALATCGFAVLAMLADPTDPGVLAKRSGQAALSAASAVAEKKNYCYHCESYVNRRSKHCRRCG